MLKVDDFTFKGDQIELLTYEHDSSPDSESDIELISRAEFEQWCYDNYTADISWWAEKSFKDRTELLETYINRPTLPIIGATDNETLDQSFN